MEYKNENGIQNNIGNGTDQYGEHGRLCLTLGGNEHIQAKRKLNKYSPDQIDGNIALCIDDRLVTGTEHIQKRPLKDHKKYGQHHRKKEKNADTVSQNFLCSVPVTFAEGYGGQRSTSRTDEGAEGGYQHQNRKGQSDSCQGNVPDILDMPDIHAVYNVIKVH